MLKANPNKKKFLQTKKYKGRERALHLDWWKNKDIERFKELFDCFFTNCPEENIIAYLQSNPFTSLLFHPRQDAGVLVKKNMPAFIIGYNQYTFIKKMVEQLEKYTADIVVIDNHSDYQPLLDYYDREFHYTVLRMKENYGHTVYHHNAIQKLAGDLYFLTDPDLEFNPHLPSEFIGDLIDISNAFQAGRVGFALLIDSDDIREDVHFQGHSIKNWEGQFWAHRLIHPLRPELELYQAAIDTTFCLINRRHKCQNIRVAGNYTCKHIPWHQDFHLMLEGGEKESYLKNNRSTNWFK